MNTTVNITPEQCRTARCLLGLTQEQLAEAAGIATKCIYDFEGRRRKAMSRTQSQAQQILENAGVTLLFDRSGRATGVRFTDSEPTNHKDSDAWPEPLHFRLARAWLNWSSSRLAEEAGLSPSVIRDFDKGRHAPHRQNLLKVELAIQLRGIRFLFDQMQNPIGITVVPNNLAVAA